jgi:hypothetical protein
MLYGLTQIEESPEEDWLFCLSNAHGNSLYYVYVSYLPPFSRTHVNFYDC